MIGISMLFSLLMIMMFFVWFGVMISVEFCFVIGYFVLLVGLFMNILFVDLFVFLCSVYGVLVV